MFEGENITLDIPKEGILLESGWTITPHTHPGVNFMLLVITQGSLMGSFYISVYRTVLYKLALVCKQALP